MWKTITNFIRNFDTFLTEVFDWGNNVIRNSEYSLISLLASLVVYTTMYAAAWFTVENLTGVLKFTDNLAILTGFNLVGVGFLLASTFFTAVEHDRKVKSITNKQVEVNRNKLPWWVFGSVFILYVVYFAILIIFNVWLPTAQSEDAIITAKTSFVVIELIAVISVSMRMYQADVLKTVRETYGKKTEKSENSEISLPDFRSFAQNLTLDEAIRLSQLNRTQLMQEFGATGDNARKTAGNWLDSHLPKVIAHLQKQSEDSKGTRV